jgi:hypothetical protein
MFSMDDFGVQWLVLSKSLKWRLRTEVKQDKVYPSDSTDQLKDWIYNARIANIEVNDKSCKSLLKVMLKKSILQSER